MKAIIISAEKQVLPQFDAEAQQDVSTLVIVCDVQFVKDDGTVYSEQQYGVKPEDFPVDDPASFFQNQADAMQADLDNSVATAQTQEDSHLADEIISKLV